LESSAAEIAAKQRYLHLLNKVKNSETLRKGELKELREYEKMTKTVLKHEDGERKTTTKKTIRNTKSTNTLGTGHTKKKQKKKGKQKKRKKAQRLPVSAALLKKLAVEGLDFTAADVKIRTKVPLTDCIKDHPSLKKAWERGRLLFNIGQQADSGASIAEAESELGLDTGGLEKLLAEDAEAADIWHQKRLSYLKRLKKIIETKAEAGNITAINKIITMHRNEMSGKSHTDFHKVTTSQMEKELGINRMNLSNWVNKQGLDRNTNGTFDLRVFVDWYGRYCAARDVRGAGKAVKEYDQRAIRAQIMKLDLQRQQGELLERDAVMAGLLARHQVMLAAHQRKTEELARLCLNQPFEKSKELVAAGLAEIRREMCHVPEMLRLSPSDAERFTQLLDGLKAEED